MVSRRLKWTGWAAACIGMVGGTAWGQALPDDAALMRSVESLRPGDVVPNSYIVIFAPSTTQRRSPVVSIYEHERIHGKRATPAPFGEHSTGQDKAALARSLGLTRGKVNRIYDAINAIHVVMTAEEAEALRNDPRVLSVGPDIVSTIDATEQKNPGWGLDRLDQTTTKLNNQYMYGATGAGQTIYILDTGLDLRNTVVAAEFGERASVFYDFNEFGKGSGFDCQGHGTQVASVAAGKNYGVAKNAKVVIVKMTSGCTNSGIANADIDAFNWLAKYAVKGTIVNYSSGYYNENKSCSPYHMSTAMVALETAVRQAYLKG